MARVAKIETETVIEVVVVIEWKTEEVGKETERIGKEAVWE